MVPTLLEGFWSLNSRKYGIPALEIFWVGTMQLYLTILVLYSMLALKTVMVKFNYIHIAIFTFR